jgi:hypothetical protein
LGQVELQVLSICPSIIANLMALVPGRYRFIHSQQIPAIPFFAVTGTLAANIDSIVVFGKSIWRLLLLLVNG